MQPEELKFAKTHEWVHLADGVATVGLSTFAVEALTDLVYIELPEVGRTVSAGESFSEIESVKAVSDIYAPVAGEIIEVNGPLADNLESLSENAFATWITKIKVSDDAALAGLMNYADYQKMCAEEEH